MVHRLLQKVFLNDPARGQEPPLVVLPVIPNLVDIFAQKVRTPKEVERGQGELVALTMALGAIEFVPLDINQEITGA